MSFSPAATLVGAMLGVGFVLGLVGFGDLKRFLARTPMLRTPDDLRAFKRVAARQMYIALAMIVLNIGSAVIVVAALTQDLVAWHDWPIAAALLLGFLLLVGPLRATERDVQRLPVPDEPLYLERERVVKAWKTSIFPNW